MVVLGQVHRVESNPTSKCDPIRSLRIRGIRGSGGLAAAGRFIRQRPSRKDFSRLRSYMICAIRRLRD
jgi:hypothetical protein